MKGILWAVLLDPLPIKPRFPQGKPHHITLAFGVEPQPYALHLGAIIPVRCGVEWWSDRIQAVSVKLPQNTPFELKIPHITVSHLEGVEPAEATAMILECDNPGGDHRPFDWRLIARIEFLEWKEESRH